MIKSFGSLFLLCLIFVIFVILEVIFVSLSYDEGPTVVTWWLWHCTVKHKVKVWSWMQQPHFGGSRKQKRLCTMHWVHVRNSRLSKFVWSPMLLKFNIFAVRR